VLAKSGPWMQRVARDERPRYFWAVIATYAALALALVLLL
jgi:hypothetical protein